jgi:hypothetical protein
VSLWGDDPALIGRIRTLSEVEQLLWLCTATAIALSDDLAHWESLLLETLDDDFHGFFHLSAAYLLPPHRPGVDDKLYAITVNPELHSLRRRGAVEALKRDPVTAGRVLRGALDDSLQEHVRLGIVSALRSEDLPADDDLSASALAVFTSLAEDSALYAPLLQLVGERSPDSWRVHALSSLAHANTEIRAAALAVLIAGDGDRAPLRARLAVEPDSNLRRTLLESLGLSEADAALREDILPFLTALPPTEAVALLVKVPVEVTTRLAGLDNAWLQSLMFAGLEIFARDDIALLRGLVDRLASALPERAAAQQAIVYLLDAPFPPAVREQGLELARRVPLDAETRAFVVAAAERDEDPAIRSAALSALVARWDPIDRRLCDGGLHLDDLAIDPEMPIEEARVVEAAARLRLPEGYVRGRYEALAEGVPLTLAWAL